MLIKRNEKEDSIKALYNSSNILASKWDKSINELTIIFKRGAQYAYKNVKPTDYTRFELAESQGKELNKTIKNNYEFKKLENIETTELIKEIHEYQQEEMGRIGKNLITAMESFLASHKNKNSIDIKELENVEFFIEKVKEMK